ncbi:MAG: hypothetical protein V5A57_00805 [Candidatus Paceibacterota bacterium]
MLGNKERTVENPEEKSKTDILKETLRDRSWVLERLEEYAFELAPTNKVGCSFIPYVEKVVNHELEVIGESISYATIHRWLKEEHGITEEAKTVIAQRNRELFEEIRTDKQEESEKEEKEEPEKTSSTEGKVDNIDKKMEERTKEEVLDETLYDEEWLTEELSYYRDKYDNLERIKQAIVQKIQGRLERERISMSSDKILSLLEKEVGVQIIERSRLLNRTINNPSWVVSELRKLRRQEGNISKAKDKLKQLIFGKLREQGFRRSCISENYINRKLNNGVENLLREKDADIRHLQDEFKTRLRKKVEQAANEAVEKQFDDVETKIKNLEEELDSIKKSVRKEIKEVISDGFGDLREWVLEHMKEELADGFLDQLKESNDGKYSGRFSRIKDFFNIGT